MMIYVTCLNYTYKLLEYERTHLQYLQWRYIHIQGKLAHMINDFRFLRKELLELHCRIEIGSSFQKDAPTKDRENFP